MAERSGMVEVELVEHDAADPAPVDHVDPVGRARAAVLQRARAAFGRVRRHRVPALAAVVVAVLAVAVPVTLSARAQQARAESLAALPGILAPLPSAPEVAWTSPVSPGTWTLLSDGHAWVRDGALVLWEQTGDATTWLRGLDVLTGEELWTSPLTTVPDLGDPGSRAIDDRTICAAPTPGGTVVCLVADAWRLVPSTDDTQADVVEAASLRLRAFAAATGETVLDEPVAVGTSLMAVGPDVVVASTASDDGPATVVRLDPTTGTERWSVDLPRPADGTGWDQPVVQLLGDEIGVGWLGTTTLVTAGGTVAGQLDSDNVWMERGHRIAPLGDGVAQLRDLDTGRVLDLGDARTQWLSADDGSVPDVLVLQSPDRLTGRDLTTGQRAWRLDWTAESTLSVAVVDGALVRQARDGLTAIDLATGDQLWRTAASAFSQRLATDGRRLLVVESVVGTGLVVAAYDVRDGRRVWEAPVPTAIQTLTVVDHRLFAVGSGGIVAFGLGRG